MVVPFTQGVDTKTDSKSLPPSKLEVLENGKFTKRLSITKRNGYTALDTDVAGGNGAVHIEAADILARREEELVLHSQNYLYSYSSASNQWIDKGYLPLARTSERRIATTTRDQTFADYTVNAGVEAMVWEDDTGVRLSVYDTDTSTAYVSDHLLSATGTRPRLVAFSGFIFAVWVEAADSTIKSLRINVADIGTSITSTPATVINDLSASNPEYDMRAYAGGAYAVLAYYPSLGGTQVKVGFMGGDGQSGSGGLPSTITNTDVSAAEGVAVTSNPTDGQIFVAAYDGSELRGLWLDGLLALQHSFDSVLVTTNPLIERLTAAYEGFTRAETQTPGFVSDVSHIQVAWEVSNAADHHRLVQRSRVALTSSSTSEVTAGETTRHSCLAGHGFAVAELGGAVVVPVLHDSAAQPTLFVLQLEPRTIIAKYLSGYSGGRYQRAHLPAPVALGDAVYRLGSRYRNVLPADEDENAYSDLNPVVLELDFSSNDSWSTSEYNGCTYFAGGVLWEYDGLAPVENGFHLFPENVSSSNTTTASGELTAGTRDYHFYWQWNDDKGRRSISTTASGTAVTISGAVNTTTFTIPTLSHTQKLPGARSAVTLAVTRTQAEGTTHYHVDDPERPVFNNPSADTITFLDIVSDAELTHGRELDYLNSEVEHSPSPQAGLLAAGKDRVFTTLASDPRTIRYSKLRVPDRSLSFFDAYTIAVPQEGGDATALAVMDDNLVVFTEDLIYSTSGPGPTNVSSDNFPELELITSDIGCNNPRSIVQTALGTFFQSRKGIYLLSRGRQVSYVGADVEGFNSQTVTAATLLPASNQVVFLFNEGKTLMYDYEHNQWSTYTNHRGIGAAVHNRTYHYVTEAGEVRVETPAHYRDVNTPIKMRLQTGWIAPQIQYFARVRRALLLGAFKSDHLMTCKIAYDYVDAFIDQITWDPAGVMAASVPFGEGAFGEGLFGSGVPFSDSYYGLTTPYGTGVYGGTSDNAYQFEILMPQQKLQAVKFQFVDTPGDNPGESYEINYLTLEIGLKDMPFRLNSNKTVGD